MGLNTPGGGGQWTLVADETLAAAGSFDVSGIAQTHAHLLLMLSGIRGDVAAVADIMIIAFNNDTTQTNYRSTRHDASGGGHTVSEGDTSLIATIPGNTADANEVSSLDIWIYDYTSPNFYKIARVNNSERRATATLSTQDVSVVWENTVAITRVAVTTDNNPADEFLANGRLQIWGFG